MNSPNCLLISDIGLPPRIARITLGTDQSNRQAGRIVEPDRILTIAGGIGRKVDPCIRQPLVPPRERLGRHRKRRLRDLTRAVNSLPNGEVSVGERRHDRSRGSTLVAVVEMVDAGIVEIDRLLDQSLTEEAGVEVEVILRLTDGRSDVVKASDGLFHAGKYVPGPSTAVPQRGR